MFIPTRTQTQRLFALHDFIRERFTKMDWYKLAYLTGSMDLIEDHLHLLCSLDFDNDDYEEQSLQVLIKLISLNADNLGIVEEYVTDRRTRVTVPTMKGVEMIVTDVATDFVSTHLRSTSERLIRSSDIHVQSQQPLPFSEQEIISRSRHGLIRSEADRVSQLVGLADEELASTLGLSASHLQQLKTDQRFSQDVSERLSLLENLLLHALDTFEGKATTALGWLRTPLRELDFQTPLQTLDTITGYTLVDRVLGRIDHGIFS